MDDLRTLTRDLVSIPSHDGEGAAGDAIADWLREHTDATVERDEAGADDGRGGNVIARKGSGETTLAFVGHHDVVPPDDSQTEGDDYAVEERDGRLYGRGSADMKGAVAAAMCAFRDADPSGIELQFVSFVGEEVGGVGARAAIDRGFVPDYAVVGEGSTGYSAAGVTDVAVAHKGRRGSTLDVSGAAAHASEPEAGENAIYRASDAVDVVRDVDFPTTDVMGHTVRGSVAVTEIDGGSAWNVIPERCTVTIDERTVPDERAPLERCEELAGVTWTVDQDLPPMQCDDPDFADAVLAAAREAHGGGGGADETAGETGGDAPQHVVKPHATDAGWLADAGATCVVCGPAEPGEAHTADESVSWAVLERCYRIYRGVAERWG
ncbi:MAG: M20 family metallopeptidase [Haloarculaceae archaeon]